MNIFFNQTTNLNQNTQTPDEDEVYKLENIAPVPTNLEDGVFDSLTGWTPEVNTEDAVFAGLRGMDFVPPRVNVRNETENLTSRNSEVTSTGGSVENPDIQIHDSSSVPSFGSVREIEVSKIFPNPFQPRKVFNAEALQELAESIKEHGVIQPVVVTQTPAGFELVVGERRFRASVLAGMTHVPAIVKEGMADLTKLEVALIENIQRHELNPIEEAHAYDRLVKGFNMTQEQIAKKLGKSRPAITNTLRLLNLPAEIQRAIIENKIAEGHARPLLSISDRTIQLTLFREILEKGLNTRQIEAKAREIVQKKSVDGLAPDPKLLALETELRGRVGAPVKIQRVGRGGKILIEFFSEEELEDIIRRVAVERAGSETAYFTV